MSQMTCEFTHVIHVAFRGIPHPKGFPYAPNDRGLIGELYEFMREHDILPATRGGCSGGGIYIASFFADDARKIIDFFDGHDVECGEVVK